MEKIEQPWEKKNLGVHSVEFRFDGTESIEKIGREILGEINFDYQCAGCLLDEWILCIFYKTMVFDLQRQVLSYLQI